MQHLTLRNVLYFIGITQYIQITSNVSPAVMSAVCVFMYACVMVLNNVTKPIAESYVKSTEKETNVGGRYEN